MVATDLPGVVPALCRRSPSDRRRRPSGPWDVFRHGRRRRQRRADEHRRPYYVDRFTRRAALSALLLMAFSLCDAVVTLYLLDAGCVEINPVMGFLLDRGAGTFLVGKLALTAACCPVFLVWQHHYLFGSTLRVSHVPPILIGIYGILAAYQLSLILMVRTT
jgi:hypothetical protein